MLDAILTWLAVAILIIWILSHFVGVESENQRETRK